MKTKPTPLTDDHLQSLQGMKEAETDAFFYTRLRARMEKQAGPAWSFSARPAWLVASLLVLLAINGWMLAQQREPVQATTSTAAASTLQEFAASYNMTLTSY